MQNMQAELSKPCQSADFSTAFHTIGAFPPFFHTIHVDFSTLSLFIHKDFSTLSSFIHTPFPTKVKTGLSLHMN